jgi:hypothetical protein
MLDDMDDPLRTFTGIFWCTVLSLAMWGVIIAGYLWMHNL